MALNPDRIPREHPLLLDRVRLNTILDVMYAAIQRRLFPGRPTRRTSGIGKGGSGAPGKPELLIMGSGNSADDVLSEALEGLLLYPVDRVRSWEGLAVTIANNKARDARRRAKSWLRSTDRRAEIHLVSGDARAKGPDGELGASVFEVLEGDVGDAESEYLKTRDALKLRDLAREILGERELDVYFGINYIGESRKEIGLRLGLTEQRIGQIYKSALRKLRIHPEFHREFGDSDQGGD